MTLFARARSRASGRTRSASHRRSISRSSPPSAHRTSSAYPCPPFSVRLPRILALGVRGRYPLSWRHSMNRVIGFALASAGVLVVASACVENKGSLFVQAVMAPPIAQAGMACIYDPQPTSPIINSGIMDVAFTTTYAPVLLMANEMVQRGNATQLRIESSRVQIQGATVRLTDASGAQIKAFTTLASGFVEASNGTQPGYGAVQIIAVDPDTTTNVLIPALAQK